MEKTKIVLSGGALKGLVYIGVMKVLEEKNMISCLKEFVGTSIGALFALILILGYTSKVIEKTFINFDTSSMINYKLNNFIDKYGFDDGKLLEEFIKSFLIAKGYNPKITMKELFLKTNKKLVCTTCKVNTKQTLYIDYISQPDIPVYLAVRMSMNLPIIFAPVKYQGEYYIDGYLSCNLPVKYFNEKDAKQVIVILLKNHATSYVEIDTLHKYITTLPKCCITSIEESDIKYAENILLTKVLQFNVSIEDNVHFKISNEDKFKLIQVGYKEFFHFIDA
jgi:NTE family protein